MVTSDEEKAKSLWTPQWSRPVPAMAAPRPRLLASLPLRLVSARRRIAGRLAARSQFALANFADKVRAPRGRIPHSSFAALARLPHLGWEVNSKKERERKKDRPVTCRKQPPPAASSRSGKRSNARLYFCRSACSSETWRKVKAPNIIQPPNRPAASIQATATSVAAARIQAGAVSPVTS